MFRITNLYSNKQFQLDILLEFDWVAKPLDTLSGYRWVMLMNRKGLEINVHKKYNFIKMNFKRGWQGK